MSVAKMTGDDRLRTDWGAAGGPACATQPLLIFSGRGVFRTRRRATGFS